MIYWGALQNGEQLLLGCPEEAVLSYDREAPADQLKAVFPADRVWPELAEVLAYREGQGVFRGIVDEQNTRLTGSGLSVELVCRSREALLLDNEAEPGTIRNPSAEALSRRLLEPLGLRPGAGLQPAAGSLFIEKGTSCWTVLGVYVWGPGGPPSQELLDSLSQELEALREVGAAVSVKAAAAKKVNIGGFIKVLPGAVYAGAEAKAKEALAEWFAQRRIGDPVYLGDLSRVLLRDPAVCGVTFAAVTKDVPGAAGVVPVLGSVALGNSA